MIYIVRIILIIILIRILLKFLFRNYFYKEKKKKDNLADRKKNPIGNFNKNVQDADFEEID